MTAVIELVEHHTVVEIGEPAQIQIVEPATRIEVAENDAALELVENVTRMELSPDTTIELAEQSTVIELGAHALQGPPGADATNDIAYPAASSLSGHRVVLYDQTLAGWIYADRTTPAHAGAQLAVTLGAITGGASGAARLSGTMDEPSWSWPAPCPLYLDTAGQLTATPPTAGFVREVARAITPTRINIEPEPAIVLAP